MKFNKYIPLEQREFLESQYKEYIKNTPMTKKEQRVLREWVKDGNSVYENTSGAWYEGQVLVEFLTVYRDEEYIRQHTKGMEPADARKFAMAYYGWDDEDLEVRNQESAASAFPLMSSDSDEELPFN